MKRAYDRSRADRLVPLLRSIQEEMHERLARIRTLSRRVARLEERAPKSPELAVLVAELAVQRRELRHAQDELRALGCTFDPEHPTRIRIPGESGDLETGYGWDLGDTHVYPLILDRAG